MFTRKLLQRTNTKYNSYEDRLKILGLESLELRRLHSDLITVYKILNNLIDIDFADFFEIKNTDYNLRHHRLSLKKPIAAKTSILQNSFKYRVVDTWNSLPENLVTSKSLAIFKIGLKKHSFEQFLDKNK